MNTHRTDLSIDNLQKAFSAAFTWVVERDRESGIGDFAGAWVDLLASALQDVRLTATPAIDADSPPLKFLQTHRIATTYSLPPGAACAAADDRCPPAGLVRH